VSPSQSNTLNHIPKLSCAIRRLGVQSSCPHAAIVPSTCRRIQPIKPLIPLSHGEQKIANFLSIALIAAEVLLISLFAYAVGNLSSRRDGALHFTGRVVLPAHHPAAHLTAIHSSRRYDTQVANFCRIAVALVWSVTEVLITWPHFPVAAFILNTFTRSVAFTVIGRVMIKLWREREYAHKDSLTGLANRLELMERMEIEQRRSERFAGPTPCCSSISMLSRR